ncbi:hypothetical protein GLOIN_2v1788898 [Rhizophagus irregularis DAOM 181602=DAOM 197198]|uniref:Uncharacterized protein n=1 Tax=Rhizophagus irregularis (strain DAOM 181602 / DAOM 197198 / MUCL 43194) TaxID=747089 RepID=A0A2P4P2K0_RHIID|nr:hypothetical protein GLOIN_2v1788898 [Rhizophagus irregularis DAOM 181602=DAOM 197198]POG59625.1 hypothetical protein GLOIN_2v1788898 [Rhizophagus irregularis DAOM 181602=DAOM 197198]|eukprot:XP_025166491.1 hypothetical protein GLOIN_2v1788898 [Rhizophagus irregularis DAOM 181602=DAOM 197198]
MDDANRSTAFFYLADESALEYDDESALNPIYFYNNIDKGTFDEHKDDYVLVYKQEVKKYGTSEYTSKELEDLEDEMPDAIYLPVDKKRRDSAAESPPARTVSAHHANQEHMELRRPLALELNFNDPAEDGKLYKTVIDSVQAIGYGHPAHVYYASSTFEIALGDNNGWSKWVSIDILRVWEKSAGDQVDRSLVGIDVLDQFSFVHEPAQGFKF